MKPRILYQLIYLLLVGALITFVSMEVAGDAFHKNYSSDNHSVDAGDDQEACYGDTITLSASASGGIPPYNYTWYSDEELTQVVGSGNSLTVTVEHHDIYYVVATDASGGTSTDEVNVYLDLPQIGYTSECDPEGIYYILHVFSDSDENVLTSDLGVPVDIGEGEWKLINIPLGDSVTFYITSETGCTATEYAGPPDCDLCALMVMVNDTTICEGGTANLVANVGWGYPPYTYSWSDDPSFSNILGTEPTLSTTTPGTYYVKTSFTIDTDPNSPDDELIYCEAIDSATVTVLADPIIANISTECDSTEYGFYSITFTVGNGNSTTVAGSGSFTTPTLSGPGTYTVEDIPLSEDVTITSTNDCGETSVVEEAPDCVCPPPVIGLENDPVCDTVSNTYDVTFTLSGDGALSATVNVNNDTYDGPGPHTVNDIPAGTDLVIVAMSDCTSETDSLTVTDPCPQPCDPPVLALEGDPMCDTLANTYSAVFSISGDDNLSATVNVNNDTYDGPGPHTVNDIPAGTDLVIVAMSDCTSETDSLTVTDPCPQPCDPPVLALEGDPMCDTLANTYSAVFSISGDDNLSATVNVNNDTYDGPGPHTVNDIPAGTDLVIVAMSDCTTETDSLTVTDPCPQPCDPPVLALEGDPMCDTLANTYSAVFSISGDDNLSATVNVNNDTYDGPGPHTVNDIPAGTDLVIVAMSDCTTETDSLTVTDPCPQPCDPPVLALEGDPICDTLANTYSAVFSISGDDNLSATVNVNNDTYDGPGPHTVNDIPAGTDLVIVAMSDCTTETDSLTVTDPCPQPCDPPVLALEGDPMCDTLANTYSAVFSISGDDNLSATVNVNNDTYDGPGPHTVNDIPAGTDLVIVAMSDCTSETDSLTVTDPCPQPCDPPVLALEGDPMCDTLANTYSAVFSISGDDNLSATVNVNNDTYDGPGPHTVNDIPAGTDLVIVAMSDCTTETDSLTVTDPCPQPCDPPVLALEGDPICDTLANTYSAVFSISGDDNLSATVNVNNDTYDGPGPHTVNDIPAGTDLVIVAMSDCTTETDSLTVPDPCPQPCDPPVLALEGDPMCDTLANTYSAVFSISGDDNLSATVNVNNDTYDGPGPHTVNDIPAGTDLVIVAMSDCTTETDSLTVTDPCPQPCDPPVLALEGDPMCDTLANTYSAVFSISGDDNLSATVNVNNDTYDGPGPHTVNDIPAGTDLVIVAMSDCTTETDSLTVTDPCPQPCDPPVLALEGDPMCDTLANTYSAVFSISGDDNLSATVNVNNDTYDGPGPHTVNDIPAGTDLVIVAMSDCTTETDSLTVTDPCPQPCDPPVLALEGDPMCDTLANTYSAVFSISGDDNLSATVNVNNDTYDGPGPHTVNDIPAGTDLVIVAMSDCTSETDSLTVTDPCPQPCDPPVLALEGDPMCDTLANTYSAVFSISGDDNLSATVNVNNDTYDGPGPHTVNDIPAGTDLVIVAMSDCTTETDSLTVTDPCPQPCDPPVLALEGDPMCDTLANTYSAVFSISGDDNLSATVNVNNDTYDGPGPHTVNDIPAGTDLVIVAMSDCTTETDSLTVTDPCPPCPDPVISIDEITDCDTMAMTYTVTFSVIGTGTITSTANGETFNGAGPFTVVVNAGQDLTITTTDDCGTDTETVPDQCVCPDPVISIDEITDCDTMAMTYTVTFSVIGTGTITSTANGETFNGAGPFTVVVNAGQDLTITTTDDCGTDTETVPDQCVCPDPVISIDEITDCDTMAMTYTVTFSVIGTGTITSTANGETFNGAGPFTVVVNAGQDLTITTTDDCGTDTETVPDQCVCPDPVISIDEITDCDTMAMTYTVTFSVIGTGTITSTANGETFNGAGPFTVVVNAGQDLTITTTDDCGTDSETVPDQCVCPDPVISIDEITDCDTMAMTYTVTFSVIGTGTITSTANGETFNGAGPFTVVVNAGQDLTITTTDDCGTDTETVPDQCVCPDPVISIDEITDCDTMAMTYTVTFSVIGTGTITSTANGETFNGAGPFTVVVNAGQDLTITTTDDCGTDSETVPDQCVCPDPVISIDEITDCDTMAMTYTVTFSVIGTGTITSTANGETFNGAGPFTVVVNAGQDLTITTTDDCGTDTETVPDQCVCPDPVISIDEITDCDTMAMTYTVTFSVIGTGTITSTANGETFNGAGPFTVVVNAGQDLTITTTDDCGTDTETVPDQCQTCLPPDIIIEGTPECDTLTDTYNVTFLFSGQGSLSGTVNVNNFVYLGPGPHIVTNIPAGTDLIIYATSDCASDTSTLTVLDPCVECPDIIITDVFCLNDTSYVVQLTTNIGATISADPYDVEPLGSGTFEVGPIPYDETVTISSTLDTCTIDISIPPPPAILVDSVRCAEDGESYEVFFTVYGADSVQVSIGTLEEVSSIHYLLTVPIDSLVSISATSECGPDQSITVLPPPCPDCELAAIVDNDQLICVGESAELTVQIIGGSGDYSISWFDNPNYEDPVLGTDTTLTVMPSFTNTYYIEIVDNNIDDCIVRGPAGTITVGPKFFSGGPICESDSTSFFIQFETDADVVTTSNGILEFQGENVYNLIGVPYNETAVITMMDEEFNCFRDTIIRRPECCLPCLEQQAILAKADNDENMSTIHRDQGVELSVDIIDPGCLDCTEEDYTIQWGGPGNIREPNSRITQFTPGPELEPGCYVFTVEVGRNMECCDFFVQDTVSVLVLPLCDIAVYVPNAFSPNGDGMNDQFRVRGHDVDELNLAIYDRWGEKIIELNSLDDTWDGTFKGKVLPSDVYGYYMTARCFNGEQISKKGNITLLK